MYEQAETFADVRTQEKEESRRPKVGKNCNECHKTTFAPVLDEDGHPTGKGVCPNCGAQC